MNISASRESRLLSGINFEHSFIDGHTVLRFASDAFTETILRFAELIRGGFIARTSGARDVEAVQAVTHKIGFRHRPKFTPILSLMKCAQAEPRVARCHQMQRGCIL
jgi:hypothetical protein